MKRRNFIKGAAAMAAMPLVSNSALASGTTLASNDMANTIINNSSGLKHVSDEAFWQQVRQHYQLPSDVIQLENGNWGVMSKSVLQSYMSHTQRVNQYSSHYSRREFMQEFKPIHERVATILGCAATEIAFARGATEVLNNLIAGYRNLKPNDVVMYADTDYDSMQAAMCQRSNPVVKINLPERASAEEYVAFYRAAIEQHPRVKLLLLTHLSHRHGLVLPIKKIVAMAREYGVDCIVDAAHSWGQINFNVADLGADFVGFNLHKWMGAPIGVGVMYIKSSRLADIAPAIGDTTVLKTNSKSDTPIGATYNRIHTGTFNYAAWLAVPAALDFHDNIGGDLKAARIKYLRDYWVNQVAEIRQVQLVASNEPDTYAGICSFRLYGETSVAGNEAIAAKLLQQHKIFSVHRNGLANGACVRITPALFNTTAEMNSLAQALKAL
uniref:Aminotransferase class-V n=2 Tax=Pseudoalteromonas TaxID=53246 RepID=A0A6G6AQR2_PSET1|nr:Aminotransferase class-V [Pseudoalteromonas translucida TAC125]